jgi:hypothetical protein
VSSLLKQNGFVVGVRGGQSQPPLDTVWYSPDISRDRLSPIFQALQNVGINPIIEKSNSVGAHTVSLGSFVVGAEPSAPTGVPIPSQDNSPCRSVAVDLYINSIANDTQRKDLEKRWSDFGMKVNEIPFGSREQSINSVWHGQDVPTACWHFVASTLTEAGFNIRQVSAPEKDTYGKRLRYRRRLFRHRPQ